MANVWTANWDALSTGVTWTTSTPAGWSPLTIGGQLTQETYTGLAGSPPTQSSPNVLRFNSGTGITGYIWRATLDGNSGDSAISAKVWFQSGLGTSTSDSVGLMCRIGNGSGAGGTPTLSGISEYIARLTGAGVLLDRQTATTVTNIATVGAAGLLATGIWYVVTLTAVGTTIKVRVQRLSDNQYLTSGATWQAGAVDCVSVTDANVAGAGYGGLKIGSDGSGMVAYIDDVSFDTAAATVPATGITLTGPASGFLNQATTNFTVALDPSLGTTTGDVTVTPATDLTGTFTPTTVVLNTATQSATFTFTPDVIGTHEISITNDGSLDTVEVEVTQPPVTVGVLSIDPTTANNTQVVVESTAPSGGTNPTPFDFAWEISDEADGSYTSVGANSDTLTLTVTELGSVGNIRFVRCTYADDDVPPNEATTYPFPVSLWNAPRVFGVGPADSLWAENWEGELNVPSGVNNNGTGSAGGKIGTDLHNAIPLAYVPSTANTTVGQVAGLSQARTGTTASGWDPGGANHYTSDAWTNVWEAAGLTDALCMIGMNDGVAQEATKSAYKTALQACVDYLTAEGVRVSLIRPYFPNIVKYVANNPGDTGLWPYEQVIASSTLIMEYGDAMDEIAAADTTGLVRVLSDGIREKFAADPSLYHTDGIHPSAAGSRLMRQSVTAGYTETWLGDSDSNGGGGPGGDVTQAFVNTFALPV
jgi:lysophospholipase L1-like esterase